MRICCRFLANNELEQLICRLHLFLFTGIGRLCLHPRRKRKRIPAFHTRSNAELVHMTAHVTRARSRELPALIAMRTWIAHVISLLARYRACIMHHRGLFDKEKGDCPMQPPILCDSGGPTPNCRIRECGDLDQAPHCPHCYISASPSASRTRAASTSWPSSNVATVTRKRTADFISSRSAP